MTKEAVCVLSHGHCTFTHNGTVKLLPLDDRIIIDPIAPQSITSGGIVLPETNNQNQNRTGIVVAIGPGKRLDDGSRAPMLLQLGQKVLYDHRYSGWDIEEGNHKYRIMRESDVLATVKEDK